MSKADRINLGLDILNTLRRPGQPLSCEDIAAYCGCIPEAIRRTEQTAMRKVRLRLKAVLRGEVADD